MTRDVEYAHLARRLLAACCDGAIGTALTLLAFFTAAAVLKKGELSAQIATLVWFLWFLGNVTYSVGASGQSWGRRLLGVKVVKADGQPAGFWRILGRNLFAIHVSFMACFLGFLWVAWGEQRQAWHDKAFGTFVLRTDP